MPPKVKVNEDDFRDFEDRIVGRLDTISEDIANIRATIIDALLGENKRLEARITKLEMENNALQQYGRQNNIEVNGIDNSVPDSEIESKVIEIFDSINITVTPNDIEAAHRLPSKSDNKPVIVKETTKKRVY